MATSNRPRIKPKPDERHKTPTEIQKEEAAFRSDETLRVWLLNVVEDPRFRKAIRAVERRRPLKGLVQETPHGQHVADGFAKGFASALSLLEGLPYAISAAPENWDGELEQAEHPELDDGHQSESTSRFR